MSLDDRLWLLQQNKELTEDQKERLTCADIHFLQNREDMAWRMVIQLEKELNNE